MRRTALWYRQHKASVERDDAILGPASEMWDSGWVKRPLETHPLSPRPERADVAAFAGSTSPPSHPNQQ